MAITLDRFLKAQKVLYSTAMKEITEGRKKSHWMWFVFPQLCFASKSITARYYSFKDYQEAVDYFYHPILGMRLKEISTEVLNLPTKQIGEIFVYPDDVKFWACMTLFDHIDKHPGNVFQQNLEKYFNLAKHPLTINVLQ